MKANPIKLRKNAKKNDLQKAIVLRLLEVLEQGTVWRDSNKPFENDFSIKKGISFEALVIEEDLKNEK